MPKKGNGNTYSTLTHQHTGCTASNKLVQYVFHTDDQCGRQTVYEQKTSNLREYYALRVAAELILAIQFPCPHYYSFDITLAFNSNATLKMRK